MLLIPSIDRIGKVSIYADDTLFYRFYPVADAPRLRVDDAGDPVFLLLSYALSDEDRAAKPDLPAGGGYLSFDTTFELAEAELAAVRDTLKPRVAAEWNRLRNGTPQEQARPGVAGTSEPPAIELATPTWTEGVVSMDAPQSAALIEARVAESEPSLAGGQYCQLLHGSDAGRRRLHGTDAFGGRFCCGRDADPDRLRPALLGAAATCPHSSRSECRAHVQIHRGAVPWPQRRCLYRL